MPLDWPIRSVISNAAFWRDYFWQSESSPAGDGYWALVNHEAPVSKEQAAQLDWVLHLDRDLHPKVGLYTLRHKDNPDFPFKQFGAALDEAARI